MAPAHPDANLAHHFADMEQQTQANTLGIWLFLATEVLFFGAIFAAYAIYRDRWNDAFTVASMLLDVKVAAVNTVVLIGSSLTVVLAVHSIRLGRLQQTQLWLLATAVLGITFLGIKVYEYAADYREGMIPGIDKLVPGRKFEPRDWTEKWVELRQHQAHEAAEKAKKENLPEPEKWTERSKEEAELEAKSSMAEGQLFFCFYFIMTGLHATHMIIGLVIFGILIYQTRVGMYTPNYHSPIEATGLYWHFVDIVWVFLFPLLYLIRH